VTFGALWCVMRKGVSIVHRAYGRETPLRPIRSTPGSRPVTAPLEPQRKARWTPGQLASLLMSGAILTALWQAITVLFAIPAWLLPGPLTVLSRFAQAWNDGTLAQHIPPTVIASVGGFGLALLVGVALGYLVAHSRTLERLITPYFAAMQAIPVIAVAPLILIWFGYSSDILRNTLIAALVVVFPIFSSMVAAIRAIPRELRDVALVEGASRIQRIRFVEVPLALPVLFSGFRTSLAFATTGAVIGEFIGARYGLGALVNVARGFFDTPLIFVALLCLALITLLFGSILLVLERILLPWND
jgi:NitT/TauT family transport system permease protein